MAKRGLAEFTVQEAVNTVGYNDWNYEELDLNDPGTTFTDDTCDTNHTSGISDGESSDKAYVSHTANSNIVIGLEVTGTGIPASTYIIRIRSATVFEMSNDATATNTNEELTFEGGSDSESSTYITSKSPAKKIILSEVPGSSGSHLQDIDTLTLTLNGETATAKKIVLDASDLPFTISGTIITSLSVACEQANLTDKIALLSFH